MHTSTGKAITSVFQMYIRLDISSFDPEIRQHLGYKTPVLKKIIRTLTLIPLPADAQAGKHTVAQAKVFLLLV